MNIIRRYDVSTNMWLIGYYSGSRFYVINKVAV